MKLRLSSGQNGSIRIRLSRAESQELAGSGRLTENISLGPDRKIILSLRTDSRAELDWRIQGDLWECELPEEAVKILLATPVSRKNRVSGQFQISMGNALEVAVEVDLRDRAD